jgi:NADH:ubiquinone oxidoreductase subunit 4 (subunit M)
VSRFIFLGLLISLGIIVKLPIFLVHNWLPKAHVEAPVFGSIILAGILLKLGAVGLIRVKHLTLNTPLFGLYSSISFVGLVIISILVLAKTDIKQIVAFRSILHIAFPIVIFELSTCSRNTVLVLALITHAFRSSGLFYLVFCFYSKAGSRSTIIIKGCRTNRPRVIFFWILLIVARLGGPPRINLLTELIVILQAFHSYGIAMVILLVPCVVICAFHLIMYASPVQNMPEFRNFSEAQAFSPNSTLIRGLHSLLTILCLANISVFLAL